MSAGVSGMSGQLPVSHRHTATKGVRVEVAESGGGSAGLAGGDEDETSGSTLRGITS
jgi:hypothetical protein